MTDRELMQQALEALQKIYIAPEHEEYIRVWWPACEDAILALRERLAQPEQEPSADEVIASHAKRLALTLEALLLSCEETAVVSKWWSSAHMALGQYQDDIDRLYPQDHISPLGKD